MRRIDHPLPCSQCGAMQKRISGQWRCRDCEAERLRLWRAKNRGESGKRKRIRIYSPPLTRDDIRKIVMLYTKCGKSLQYIGKFMFRRWTTIKQVLLNEGVKVRTLHEQRALTYRMRRDE